MFPLYDPVCCLLQTPFSNWRQIDKEDFLRSEKPMPSINERRKKGDKIGQRNFNKTLYFQFDWVCGSHYKNKLFCIPCILNNEKNNIWGTVGHHQLRNIRLDLVRHVKTAAHIRSSLEFAKLKKNLLGNNELKVTPILSAEQLENVRLNRRIMQLAIRTFIQGFGGNFEPLLEYLLSGASLQIEEQYKKIRSELNAGSEITQNGITKCISSSIDDYISNEIKLCKFFAIQIDDLTDLAQKSRISVTIRFVKPDGKVTERFLNFYEPETIRTAATLFDIITQSLEKFDYQRKLVGFSIDGGAILADHLNDLQAKIKEVAPQALLVHSCNHNLKTVLQQSLNGFPECRRFFAALNGLSLFLSKRSSTPIFVKKKLAWMPDCNILSFVTDHWDTLKDVFIEITNDPNSDQNSVRECDFFTAKFEELEFVLLVAIFKDIFQIVDEFSENLDKLKVVQVENLVNLLEEKQNETILNEHFKSIVSKTNTLCKDQDILCKKFKILYYNVLDSLILQVKTRFQDTINLRYTSLFEPLKYSSTHISMLHLVNSIEDRYSIFFSKFSRLKNEVQVYHKQQSKRTATPNFLSDLFEYSNIFQDLNKLFHLVVTLPCTRVSENEYSSCLKKIHDFQKNVVGRESVTISAKMVIEKELLEVLAEKQTFFEEVIDKFGNLEDTKIELVHKK